MVDIAIDSHLKAACKRLEDSFYLMVLIVALRLDVEIDASTVAERLEEMQEHLGRHVSYPFAVELRIPHKPRSSTEIECYLT